MAINFSLNPHPNHPGKPGSEKRLYAFAQYRETMDLDAFAKHMATHGSKFSRAIVTSVLIESVECLRDQLLLGNRVLLGDLGVFYLTLHSKGVERADHYNTDKITEVHVHWKPSARFIGLRKEATFHMVKNRQIQAKTRMQEKEKIDRMLASFCSNVNGEEE